MSSLPRTLAGVALLGVARTTFAQSTAEYRARLDSLAAVFRPLAATAEATARRDSSRFALLPADSLRMGVLRVRADSAHIALARGVAERLAPRVEATYGRFSDRLAGYQLLALPRDTFAVVTAVADSLGVIRLRSAVLAEPGLVEASWAQKIEILLSDQASEQLRHWVGKAIPLRTQTQDDWARVRADLLLSGATIARDCAAGNLRRCSEALGARAVNEPALSFFSAEQRRDIVIRNLVAMRKIDAGQVDRCLLNQFAACDSLVTEIPDDLVPVPFPVSVRESFAKFVIDRGGPGAFDRLQAGVTIAAGIEAAARMPADSVVAAWRERLLESPRQNTPLDVATAASSLFWVAVCAGLSLRSSRWR